MSMTHMSRNWHHKSTAEIWLRFLAHLSCISGTGFVWCQILVLIITLLYSRPEILFSSECCVHTVLFAFPFYNLLLAATGNSSPMTLSAMFIISARNVLPGALWDIKPAPEIGARLLESIYGTSFLQVCHGL